MLRRASFDGLGSFSLFCLLFSLYFYPGFMLKNKIHIIFLLLLSLQVSGQKILKKPSVNVDTTNVYSLLNYAMSIKKTQPAKAFDYVEKALILSMDKKDLNAQAKVYYTLANLNKDLEIYDIAINNYRQAIKLYRKTANRKELLYCYKELAGVYERKKDYANSKIYYEKYLKLAKELGYEDDIILANKGIAFANAQMKSYDESIKKYKKVKRSEAKRKNPKGVIDANNKIGEILVEQNKQDEAIEYFKKSKDMAIQTEDTVLASSSLNSLANVYRTTKEYDKELDVRQTSIELNNVSNNNQALTQDNLEIGNIYLKKNQPKQAISYIEKSLKYSEKTGDVQTRLKAQKSLSKAFAQSGEYDKALESYKKYVALKDSLLALKEKELQEKAMMNNIVLEKQRRIDSLEKNKALRDNEILILKQEQIIKQESMKKQRIIIYSLIGFLLLLLVSALLIYKSYRQKRIANQMLALKSLRSQMNPHFIFNALNSVNSFISKSDERSANKYLSEFARLMRLVLDNSKHNFIPLSAEIEMLKLYLNLEHLRFKDKFDYEFNIAGDVVMPMKSPRC